MLEREAQDTATAPERLEQLAHERCVAHLVAINDSAPPAALWHLRRSSNRIIRALIAGNPNAPFELLQDLIAEYPAEVLDNPVLTWHLMSAPDLVEKLTSGLQPDAVGGLLRCERLPRAILNTLMRSPHEDVRALAAQHVALACDPAARSAEPDVLPDAERIAGARAAFHSAVCQVSALDAEALFALRGLVPVAFLELLLDTPFVELVARSPDAPGELLRRLPLAAGTRVSLYVASHRHAPPELLAQLADCPDLPTRKALAGNPRTPESILKELARSPTTEVRQRVAANPSTDPETLGRLARDRQWRVRVLAARNPHTPLSALRALACDPEAQVRVAAIRDHRMAPAQLTDYADNPDPDVRRAVANHPDTPEKELRALAKDPCNEVRQGVARHSRSPAKLVDDLAQDREPAVRRAAAQHPRLSARMRRELEFDTDPDVRQGLAFNPQTPILTLKRLWPHASADQRRVIARHPCVTPARRAQLYARLVSPHLRRLRDRPTLARLAALSSSILPLKSYEAASRSQHWLDRYVVAENRAAPLTVVAALAHDGIISVRVAAQANLAARRAASLADTLADSLAASRTADSTGATKDVL